MNRRSLSGLSGRVDNPGLTHSSGRSESSGLSGSSGGRLSAPATLSGLSDRDLLTRVNRLVRREREITYEILHHLNEVERRRLYLPLGFGSLFDYCTRHLKYSRSAAWRRTTAATCIRKYPEVRALLEKNEVNVSTVSRVASVLNHQNKDTLLGAIRNKSQREVERILTGYKPPVAYGDRVKPVCVAVPDVYPISTQSRRNSLNFQSRCGTNIASACGAGRSPKGTDSGGLGGDQIPEEAHSGGDLRESSVERPGL